MTRISRLLGLLITASLFLTAPAFAADKNDSDDNKKKYKREHKLPFRAGQQNNKWRKAHCEKKKLWTGKVNSRRWSEERYKSSNGDKWDRGQVCEWAVNIDDKEQLIFEDGCSGQWPSSVPLTSKEKTFSKAKQKLITWGTIFHQYCARHDFCYHHNPITYGKSQADCDRTMENGMDARCKERYPNNKKNRKTCLKASKGMYLGLRIAGKKHYRAFNTKLNYLELYPDADTRGTSAKCPARFKRVGVHKGLPLCRSGVKLKKRKCKGSDRKIINKGKDCRSREKDYYKLRTIK